MKKIKFHSIYYRFILFIFTFAILVINMIIADKNAIIQISNFSLKLEQLNYIFIGIFITVIITFSIVGWKFYICKETQNRRISVPDVKFEELSIWENRKRLENFSRIESERLYVPNATFVKVYKIAGMVTLIVDSGTAFFNKANTPIFNLPEKYRPNETLYFSASYRNSSKSNTFFLYANGDLAKSEADDNAGAYYFTISYPAKSIN